MIREEVLGKIVEELQLADYQLAQQYGPSCFDILARKDHIILIKVLTNIDSFYEEHADDLKRVAKVLDATPLIVGVTASGQCMRERTIYERFGISAVSIDTFREVLEGKLPIVYAKRGGFYAHINAPFLKKVREKQHISLTELAREAGVSKTALQNYEKGEGAEVENIIRLQDALGDLVLDPLNIFKFEAVSKEVQQKTKLEKDVTGRLHDIGFKTTTVTKAAFRMIGKHGKEILLTGMKKQPLEKKAHDIHEAASALGQHGMFVFEHAKQKTVSGVPILEKEELAEIFTSKELLKILEELSEEG